MAALFTSAVVRLGARGVETFRAGLGPVEWAGCAVLTALFVWGEGYRALQRRYVPWVVERATAVEREEAIALRVLAPLYAMALVGAARRVTLRAWAGLVAIGVAVVVVRALPDPWRGITDFAVAAALAWGLGALLRSARRAL